MLSACGGTKLRKDPELAQELLIEFSINAESQNYLEAIKYINKEERQQLLDENGDIRAEYLLGFRNLNLSKIKSHQLMVDQDDKLAGMFELITGITNKNQISEEQRRLKLEKRAGLSIEKTDTTTTKPKVLHRSYDPYSGVTTQIQEEAEE